MQFLRPLNRERLISSIYAGLNRNGCLLLVKKVLGEHSTSNRLFINHYYAMKRRKGYSEIEIAQKREALENVLIPYREFSVQRSCGADRRFACDERRHGIS